MRGWWGGGGGGGGQHSRGVEVLSRGLDVFMTAAEKCGSFVSVSARRANRLVNGRVSEQRRALFSFFFPVFFFSFDFYVSPPFFIYSFPPPPPPNEASGGQRTRRRSRLCRQVHVINQIVCKSGFYGRRVVCSLCQVWSLKEEEKTSCFLLIYNQGSISRTGYRTCKMALRQFCQVATSGTTAKKIK